MKAWSSFLSLILILIAAAPAFAEEKDPFKDIVIFEKPQDFEAAKALAKQNRLERIDRIHDVMNCIQQSKTVDDIYNCQELEADVTARIRLAYCDTGVSWLYLDARRSKKKNKQNEAASEVSECDKARQVIENIKARRASEKAEAQTPEPATATPAEQHAPATPQTEPTAPPQPAH